ncbi:diacylglycerol/lipid kinase family protein [Chloroflexota bacterium]
MPDKKIKIIVNPNADFGRGYHSAAELRPVIEEFGGADWAGTVYPTHAVELAKSAAQEGYKIIVAAGGDGTIHEVVNGLMQIPAESRPQLGVVPIGSGNDFSHSLGMDTRPAYALRQILTGQVHKIDVGHVSDDHGRSEYFSNATGIGFDATVGFRFRKMKFLRGFLGYLVAVIQTVMIDNDAPVLKITTDNQSWEEGTLMLVICNGPREGGGFMVAPDALSDDGVFNYASICQVSRFMMFRLIPEVMKGTHGRFSQVRMGKLTRIDLESDRPLSIHMDGEIFSGIGVDVRKLSLEIIPAAIEVVS